jgi:hypothetical protein
MSKSVLFYGKASQLDDVITHATVKFLADNITTDSVKVGYLASLFRGAALTWLTDSLPLNPDWTSDYSEFLAQIKQAFALDDKARTAQISRELTNLRQRKDVQSYALRFSTLQRSAKLPQQTAVALFIKGLKPNIRNAIILNDDQDGIDEAIAEATRIDSQLFYSGPASYTGKSGNFKGRKFTKSNAFVKKETY